MASISISISVSDLQDRERESIDRVTSSTTHIVKNNIRLHVLVIVIFISDRRERSGKSVRVVKVK